MQDGTLRRSDETRQTDSLFNESFDEDADYSFDERNHQSYRMEDMTIADLPDSEREKVSRLVEKLVSLGREQEELVADLAYERSRHASEIETSSQKLQQRCRQFEQEKGQLEEKLAEANGKQRYNLSLLHLYQVSLEKYVVDNVAMSEALAAASTGGSVGTGRSLHTMTGPDGTERESERVRELKATISRMEVLSRSQQAIIETMQSAHHKTTAAHQMTVDDLSLTVLKLSSADERLRDCESQLALALATKSDSVAQSHNMIQQKQYLGTMERACEGMARQLAEMTLRLEEKENQIRVLSGIVGKSSESPMMLNHLEYAASARFLSASISSTATEIAAEHHTFRPSILKSFTMNRMKESRKDEGEIAHQDTFPLDIDAVNSLRTSSTKMQKDRDRERERIEDDLALALGNRLGQKEEFRSDASVRKSWTSIDDRHVTDQRPISPTLSNSPRREAKARITSGSISGQRDLAQYDSDEDAARMRSNGGGSNHNMFEESSTGRARNRPPPSPFPTRPVSASATSERSLPRSNQSSDNWGAASPQSKKELARGLSSPDTAADMSAEDFPTFHCRKRMDTARGGSKAQQRQSGKKERPEHRVELPSPSYMNTRTHNQTSGTTHQSYIASPFSATERKSVPSSSSLRLSQSHTQQARRQAERSFVDGLPYSNYQPPSRVHRPPTQGSILTINGAINYPLHSAVAVEREKQGRRRQEGEVSTVIARDKVKERDKSYLSFDGERDGYDLQLFDLLDTM